MRICWAVFLLSFFSVQVRATHAQARATIVVEVYSGDRPVEQVEVSIAGQLAVTNARGEASFRVGPGEVKIHLQRFGFASKDVTVSVATSETARIRVELEPEVTHKEEITVTATRTDTRLEDEPLHIEVVTQEEVDEKTMMTPGDIAMLLNETSGVRVQVTSPSLGAANVRIQGLRGRYTLLLADGLPLYGGQSGAIGLLQIPPLDLGQVEVLKGVASALYGSSALGGVINLISRKPQAAERELLLNQTTHGGTDSVFWVARPVDKNLSYSFLGGGHYQKKNDVDDDGWADLPGYRRLVLRPRIYWDNGSGRSIFATVGAMAENREGGSIDRRFGENLKTRRFDGGLVARFAVGTSLLSVRGSTMTQSHRHQFGDVVENDRHQTFFGEASFSGSKNKHTWVIGSAVQADLYGSREVSRFDYSYVAPGFFIQEEYRLTQSVTVSASGRLDHHNRYGDFFNPRVSALLRLNHGFVARVSGGTGVYVPTPFTEETEAIGLSRVLPLSGLNPERARSASGDIGWSGGSLDVNVSVFGSMVRNTLMLTASPDGATRPLRIVNAPEPTRTAGSEMFVRLHRGPYTVALTHTYVKSTEISRDLGRRAEVPLTPKHTAGVTAFWERENRARIGFEAYYTGRQRLEGDPYREASVPYWLFGGLIEKRLGVARVYLNAENLGNIRQSHHSPLLRQNQSFEGQMTVDQWAPLEGRILNAGIRFRF